MYVSMNCIWFWLCHKGGLVPDSANLFFFFSITSFVQLPFAVLRATGIMKDLKQQSMEVISLDSEIRLLGFKSQLCTYLLCDLEQIT